MGNRMTRIEIESILSEVGACPIGNGSENINRGVEGLSSSSSSISSSCVISADQMLSLLSTTQQVRA